MNRGFFITLEGGEGAGKSTCLDFVREQLEGFGRNPVVTREPGGTELGERIRELLLTADDVPVHAQAELLLMFAARAQHLQTVILPALGDGHDVLCDRFTDATYAYQGGGRGIAHEQIATLENWVQQEFRPDLTLLLDIPVDAGLARAGKRGAPDRFESETLDFFNRVREAYLDAARKQPMRIKLIDASLPLDEVEDQLAATLKKFLDAYN